MRKNGFVIMWQLLKLVTLSRILWRLPLSWVYLAF